MIAMFGAIAGDVVGSTYERNNVKHKGFALLPAGARFTDDTVLTLAVARALLSGEPLAHAMRELHGRYPEAGFGPTFRAWIEAGVAAAPPRSDSNGAAMRIAPTGWAFGTLEAVLDVAERITRLTHDHPEAVKGAQATATAVFLARHGAGKDTIRRHVETSFGYDLSVPLEDVRPHYSFDLSCAGTVPHAIRAFLEAQDFEDALRNAVSLGGDSDTLACIAGAIAEAYFGGVPEAIARPVWERLDEPLRLLAQRFCAAYDVPLAPLTPDAAGPPAGG